MKYTQAQIKECKDYLSLSVKEGYLDESTARDLVERKAWKEVYDMMSLGDFYANEEQGSLEALK